MISSCMMRHISIFSAVLPHILMLNSDFSANKQQTILVLSALILVEYDVKDRS